MLKGFRRFFLLFAVISGSLFTASAQPGTWVIGMGSDVQDYPEDVLVDDQCNTYLTGHYRDTLDFGGDSLISLGQSDIFISKFDCNGGLVWKKRFGWTANELGRCMAFDKYGNIILVGEYQDSTILVSDTLFSNDTLWNGPYSGTFDVLIMKVSTDGDLLSYYAGGWYGSENLYDIAVDSRNFKLFSGMFRTFTFLGQNVLGKGYDDAFMLLMDSTGVLKWNATAAGKYIDKANGIDIIGDSLWVMGGIFQDTCFFRDSTVYSVTDFEDDVFVSCWDSSRQYRWSLVGGGPGKDHLDAVESDSDGNIYVCGRFDSTFTMGGLSITGAGELDGFIAKISKTGSVIWLKAIGGKYFDAANDLIVSDNDKILVTGYFQGEADFDGTIVNGLDSLDQDIFVAAYDVNGNLIWVRRAGGSSLDKGNAIDVDASGLITVTGVFSGTAWFGQEKLVSYGSEDIFVMRMLSDGSVANDAAPTQMLSGVRLFPNPTTGVFSISMEAAKQDRVRLMVMDLSGRVVMENGAQMVVHPGQNTLSLDASILPAGMYQVVLQGQSIRKTISMVVSR